MGVKGGGGGCCFWGGPGAAEKGRGTYCLRGFKKGGETKRQRLD